MRTIKPWPQLALSFLAATTLLAGCERDPVRVANIDTSKPPTADAAVQKILATGNFEQNAITSLNVSAAGGNTILDQTSVGTITGTLTGHFEDDLKVVIHPNGKFNAHFTIKCSCTVDGKFGIVEMVAGDTGELLSPTLASFAGRAVIKSASGDLAGLGGVLEIEGTVDVVTGLATYGYTGDIHFAP